MGGDARAKKVLICVRYHMWSTKVESPSLGEKKKKANTKAKGSTSSPIMTRGCSMHRIK